MITIERSVRSSLDSKTAFAYLSAFEHTPEWDPGTPVVRKLSSGPVAVGHEYHAEAEFRGKRQTLIYKVLELSARHIKLRGENKSVVSVDTIEVTPADAGCQVKYTAEFTLKGLLRAAEPFMKPAFQALADPAMAGIKKALDSQAQ